MLFTGCLGVDREGLPNEEGESYLVCVWEYFQLAGDFRGNSLICFAEVQNNEENCKEYVGFS